MDTGRISIHGREYKTVALRVAEFREKHPIDDGWGIVTTPAFDGDLVRVMAQIVSPTDVTVATGIAEEKRGSSQINRTSALENCETSAIGRALAAAGYGGSEYASANEVENAIQQQRSIEVIPAGVGHPDPGHEVECEPAEIASPGDTTTNQSRFELAVAALINRGATAIATIGGFDDPYGEMHKRFGHTLGAHGVESVVEITQRPAQMKFYRDVEETVDGLEETADDIALAGM